MARPQKAICPKQVLELAKMFCTKTEMAAVLDCSVDTLDRRFADIMAKGKDTGRMKLRKSQLKLAEKNATMSIWLGKQYLGQRDVDIDENKAKEFVTEIISFAGAAAKNTPPA